MAELVGDLSRSQSSFVESGGDGLAEDVGSDPGPGSEVAADPLTAMACLERSVVGELEARAFADGTVERVEQLTQVARDVGRVARDVVRRRREHESVSALGLPVPNEVDREARDRDHAPAGGTLGTCLDDDPLLRHPDDGGVHLPGLGHEIKERPPVGVRCVAQRESLTDAAAGGQHPVDEVGDVGGDGRLVVAKPVGRVAVSSRVSARGDFFPTLMRAVESRTGLTRMAPSSMAMPNMPDRHALADLAALGPCRSAMARSARLTTPGVTSRIRSSPSAGTTWFRTTDE